MFLSPLKPPTKASVSAEAINSSLYYLHVPSPDDDVLLQEVELEQEEARLRKEEMGDENEPISANPEFARLNNVRRKPVAGGNANPVPPAQQTPAPVQPPSFSPHPLPPEPAPIDEPLEQLDPEAQQANPSVPADDSAPPPLPQRPPRRPLPPVPNEEPALEDSRNENQARAYNRWSALPGYLNDRTLENWKGKYDALVGGRHNLDSRPRFSAHGAPGHSRHGSSGESPNRKSNDSRPPPAAGSGFHITLIRRDPTHGFQWNVATMSTPRMDGSPIDIEILTPGYNRFNAQNDRLSLASLGLSLPKDGNNRISLTDLKLPQPEALAPQSSEQSSGPRRFRRQVCVSKSHQEDPRNPTDTFTAPRASTEGGSPTKTGFSKLKSGYYTFTSPWNGTCTFATSVNGRSLKCKHMISGPNPIPDPNNPNPAVTVAELRFNTPFQAGHLPHQPSPHHISPFKLSQTQSFNHPTEPLTPSTQTTGTTPTTSKRATVAQFLNPNIYSRRPRSRSNTSQTSHRPSTSSTSSSADLDDIRRDRADPEDRMDLSLAREPAGGGMRGKSAKLGKLIIEDEGIKMLDLVVASCMAVWWKGYYY